MVSALRALLLLTSAVAAMAITPAPSPATGLDIAGEKFLDFGGPMQCWRVIEGIEGCTEQLLESLVQRNVKFLPSCCKAIIGLPVNCLGWIFPLAIFGISFGDEVNEFCHNLLRGRSSTAS
ncbi:uncharacterized protein J3R85_001956 [Psidium guajava]|nr:uncharacterized protein J3R85_001956 [Psidium guajava]